MLKMERDLQFQDAQSTSMELDLFAFDQVNPEDRLRDQFPNTEQPGMSYYITYASSEFFNA